MKKNERRYHEPLMGLLASMFFAVPTAVFLWLFTNSKLMFWGPDGAFIGSTGLWLILGFFAVSALIFPKFFPSMLGKVWHGILKVDDWF